MLWRLTSGEVHSRQKIEVLNRAVNMAEQLVKAKVFGKDRNMIDSHGGRIGIESEPGKGTTVTIALPIMPDECNVGLGSESDEQADFARPLCHSLRHVTLNLTEFRCCHPSLTW